MYWEQKVEYAALSDMGFRRRNNQDSYAVRMAGDREQYSGRGHLFLVADGMGGHAVGELASKIAADKLAEAFHCSLTYSFQSSPRSACANPGPITIALQLSGTREPKVCTIAACDWLATGR